MGTRDYGAWHDSYDRPGSGLHLRLLVVQDLISRALDELPPGPVRVVSMCAGQGRDVVTVAGRHRRGGDMRGLLVEVDEALVRDARRRIEAAGCQGLAVVQGDAGVSDAYETAVPVDLVVACGIFGNIERADIQRTIELLPCLCAPGAWVVWTRAPEPPEIIGDVVGWLEGAGFESVEVVVPGNRMFGVGAARFVGEPQPFERGVRLFRFLR
ncbi:MAG TPA: hypothetical protein VF230_05445 [Acidimicrobiales bacterium]